MTLPKSEARSALDAKTKNEEKRKIEKMSKHQRRIEKNGQFVKINERTFIFVKNGVDKQKAITNFKNKHNYEKEI